MKTLILICSMVGISLLSACSSLQSPCIIGQAVEFPSEEIGHETVWRMGNQIYHVRKTSTNSAAVGVVQWDETTGSHSVETAEMIISELDDYRFMNVKQGNSYLIGYMAAAGDRNMVVYPVNDEIKKYVSSGQLEPGDKDGVYELKGTKKEIDEFMKVNISTLFDTRSPIVAELVSGEIN